VTQEETLLLQVN